MKTATSIGLRSSLTTDSSIGGQVTIVAELATFDDRIDWTSAGDWSKYSYWLGTIVGSMVRVASVHGSMIVTVKVFPMLVSTPSGVTARVST